MSGYGYFFLIKNVAVLATILIVYYSSAAAYNPKDPIPPLWLTLGLPASMFIGFFGFIVAAAIIWMNDSRQANAALAQIRAERKRRG